ncbi:hypothetical protein BDW66DRAFT_140562 [Aspergillus desertorum]
MAMDFRKTQSLWKLGGVPAHSNLPRMRPILFPLHLLIIIWSFGGNSHHVIVGLERRADLSSWGHWRVPRARGLVSLHHAPCMTPDHHRSFIPEKLLTFCRSRMQFASGLRIILGSALGTRSMEMYGYRMPLIYSGPLS